MEIGWQKIPNWECLFAHRKHGLFFSVYVDDIKMAGKKQNMAHLWKKLMKNVDLDEPTSFLDDVYLGCTQRECKPNEIISDEYRKCSNHEFLLNQLKNTRVGKTSRKDGRVVLWKDMRRSVKRYIVNWQT